MFSNIGDSRIACGLLARIAETSQVQVSKGQRAELYLPNLIQW